MHFLQLAKGMVRRHFQPLQSIMHKEIRLSCHQFLKWISLYLFGRSFCGATWKNTTFKQEGLDNTNSHSRKSGHFTFQRPLAPNYLLNYYFHSLLNFHVSPGTACAGGFLACSLVLSQSCVSTSPPVLHFTLALFVWPGGQQVTTFSSETSTLRDLGMVRCALLKLTKHKLPIKLQ